MRTIRRPVIVFAVLLLVATLPAVAEVFHVNLKNGTSFATRYRPRVAEWDESKIVITTDMGNRIVLHHDDIENVTSDTEVKGFGTVINTTTIAVGWAPNDALTPDEQAAISADPQTQMRNFLQQQQRARPNYSVDQFVNVEDAGQGGLPAWDLSPVPPQSDTTIFMQEQVRQPPPQQPPGGGGQ